MKFFSSVFLVWLFIVLIGVWSLAPVVHGNESEEIPKADLTPDEIEKLENSYLQAVPLIEHIQFDGITSAQHVDQLLSDTIHEILDYMKTEDTARVVRGNARSLLDLLGRWIPYVDDDSDLESELEPQELDMVYVVYTTLSAVRRWHNAAAAQSKILFRQVLGQIERYESKYASSETPIVEFAKFVAKRYSAMIAADEAEYGEGKSGRSYRIREDTIIRAKPMHNEREKQQRWERVASFKVGDPDAPRSARV